MTFKTYFDTDPIWIEHLRAWARSEPVIKALWLFGSRSSGVRRTKPNASPIPDLDIAFEVEGETPDDRFQNAFVGDDSQEIELSRTFGVPVDLQFMDDSMPRVQSYVAATGVRFYSRDDLSNRSN